MDDTTYHRLADATLDALEAALEPFYDSGALDDLERGPSTLTLILGNGRTLVVSKHAPTQQIWLASAQLGGLHFARVADGWALPDGRTLPSTLAADLAANGIDVTL